MCVCVCSFNGWVCGNERRKEESACWVITVELSGAAGWAGCSEISGGLGGERLDAAGVTVFAEDVSIQRVAALVVPLRQQTAAALQDTRSLLGR